MKRILCLTLLFFIFVSCTRNESLTERKEEFIEFLKVLQTLEITLKQDDFTKKNDSSNISNLEQTQQSSTYAKMFENGELRKLAARIDSLIITYEETFADTTGVEENNIAISPDQSPKARLQEIVEKEAIDFFDTYEILHFYSKYFEKNPSSPPAEDKKQQ